MIRIVNLKNYIKQDNEILIKVDRTTLLGNPFIMKDEYQRDQVCDEYDEYFNNKIKIQHPNFMIELNRIYELSLTNNIALGCWCFPLRCHAETIKNYLEWRNNYGNL